MRFTNVAIEGMAYALPPETWTSSLIEEELAPLYDRLNLPHGRLELMTGIRERRFWPASYRPSEASADAGNALLEAGVDGSEVDLLIHAAVCRDRLEPATASSVHRLMGQGFLALIETCYSYPTLQQKKEGPELDWQLSTE